MVSKNEGTSVFSYRVSRRVRLVAAATTPEPGLSSPKAHTCPTVSPNTQMVEVGTGIDQGKKEKTESKNAATYVDLPATSISGAETNPGKSPEGTLKKAVSTQVQMTCSPTTRTAEVQTDFPRSPLLSSPLLPSPLVSATQPSLAPSLDGTPVIPPISPMKHEDSQEQNAAATRELSGHQYISVTDVEEVQEETLVEDPIHMEGDMSPLEVPATMETIPVASKITHRRENQSHLVSQSPHHQHRWLKKIQIYICGCVFCVQQ